MGRTLPHRERDLHAWHARCNAPDVSSSDPTKHWSDRSLLQIRPARDAAFLIGAFVALLLVWLFRAVTVPLLLAFLCAVLFDPPIRRLEAWGVPRWLSALAALLALTGIGTTLLVLGLPPLLEELRGLFDTLPTQLEHLGLPSSFTDALDAIESAELDSDTGAMQLASQLGAGLRLLSGTVTSAVSILIVTVFSLAMFVYFTARFPRLRRIEELFRPETAEIVRELLRVFEGYLRGQFLVAAWTTFGFALGFSLVGVPYALVAAALGGAFSFIPNGQMIGWVAAIAFGVLEGASADAGSIAWLPTLLYPSLVYGVSQSMETFVITPLVQGSAVRIHPLAVLGALIAGASVGGVLGVFFAIPVTACAAVLMRRLVLPAMEARARSGA